MHREPGLHARVRARLQDLAGSPWLRPHRLAAAHLGRCPAPDFLILGTQRGGTTSLHEYLARHPQVSLASPKEVQYFSLHHEKSWAWYLAHFPPRSEGSRVLAGEASPFYLFHPDVPSRVAGRLPDAKLVALLRDPVERAFSHYKHEQRRGWETRPFEQALEETGELSGLQADLLRPEHGLAFRHASYVSRGLYADQLERWLAVVPKEQLLVLKSEDLFARPEETCVRVQRFLGLDEHPLGPFEVFNATRRSSMSEQTRQRLGAFFAPHSLRLRALTGLDIDDWT